MDTSVLVVGGGPVGLGTAIGLRRWNIPCIVVERHPGLLTHPKGRGITIRTLEQLRRWGLEEEVRAAGLPPSHLAVYIGETLTAPDYQRFGGSGHADGAYSPARRLACTQDAFEPILRHEAEPPWRRCPLLDPAYRIQGRRRRRLGRTRRRTDRTLADFACVLSNRRRRSP